MFISWYAKGKPYAQLEGRIGLRIVGIMACLVGHSLASGWVQD